MQLITIKTPQEIKVGKRYRSRYQDTDGKYLYFEFWIEKRFFLSGYRIKTKFVFKGKPKLYKNSHSGLSENIYYKSLSQAKKALHFAFCDPDFNTVWEVGK